MKLQVIIADDEYFIRQKIKKIIPWEKLNLTYAGEAENGLKVLELLDASPCDILLLDNRMPKLDGLKTLEIIRKRCPDLSVIVISGYNEFEYARTALRFGVTDYLLKPVDSKNLEQSLKNCIASIKRRKDQEMGHKKLMHYERCTLLSDIRNGFAPLHRLFDLDASLRDYTHSLYIGAYVQDDTLNSANRFISLLRDYGYYGEYTKESDYITLYQIFLKSPADSGHLGPLLIVYLETCPVYAFFSIGKIFSLAEEWEPYYKRCMYLLHHRFFTPANDMVLEHTPLPMPNYSQELPKIRRNIALLINGKNEADFTDYIEKLFALTAKRRSVDFLQIIIMELFMNYRIHDTAGQPSSDSINSRIQALLEEEHDLDNVKLICLSHGLSCLRKNDAVPSDVVLSKKIITYIRQNYSNPNLSVAHLAERFQLNASYLGSVFKKTNQISILQFITQTRMEAATKLMHSGSYKISEIADLVGYSDVFYFSKRFKKSFGYSPKDYAAKENTLTLMNEP